MASGSEVRQRVAAVRRFNRFYTRQIGVLNEGLLDSSFSLTEVRVLFELSQRRRATATELLAALALDGGYLSRMLRRFARAGLVTRAPSREDRRRTLLALTAKGREVFAALDERSNAEVRAMLDRLAPARQARVLAGMRAIESLLEPREAPVVALRGPVPGDMGWITHRHGVLYAEEYGWDWTFEALVGEIVSRFVTGLDAARERCWIADVDGEVAGSIFCVRQSATVARLRLLYVEPWARGLGIGGRLVRECTAFARSAGYRRMTLWTNDVLHSARKIYVAEGFRLVKEERHHSFGKDLVGQNWELALRAPNVR
jgi:DNA-binding MarR family transcriptional regulator/GNAT superfamily N-acetyltransferase